MESSQKYIETTAELLIAKTEEFKKSGWRLAQIHCTKKEKCELIYTFEKEYEIEHLKIVIEKEQELDSISGIFSYAFIYENEISDLFGVKINNMNIDFKGNFYKMSVKTPFDVKDLKGEDK